MPHTDSTLRWSADWDTATMKHRTVTALQRLTMDDRKILGTTTQKRLEKTSPAPKYNTRSFQTYKSSWTPKYHKPSNNSLFMERKELVSNWFDQWTDAQRKRFLDALLRQCRRPQQLFVWNWFEEHIPRRRHDFTAVLPRFLSCYIFSFLDPRSLSRASQVSWHWHFVADQDVVWQQKCTRLGWYLPYEPPDNEYGAWKKHYVSCLQSLDLDGPSSQRSAMYGSIGDGRDKMQQVTKKRLTVLESSQNMLTRQPWLPPDTHPKDFDKTNTALLYDHNPNVVPYDPATLVHHNKFGVLKSRITNYDCLRDQADVGLMSTERKGGHRALENGDDEGLQSTGYKASLTEKLGRESHREQRVIDLIGQPWEDPATAHPTKGDLRPNLSGGGSYPVPWKYQSQHTAISKSFPSQAHPRIIFISSRVPAAEVLVDAVLFGVIPIVYEYEGTTLDSLLQQLDTCLQGRNAQSVGLFAHAGAPGDLQIVQGATVNIDNLDRPDFVEFFGTLASDVCHPDKKGHVDFFVPLASTESGQEMMTELGILTGMCFTSPTGIIGNYNHVSSPWSPSPESGNTPELYFCRSKLQVWANTADQVAEACRRTKEVMSAYFDQKQKDILSQVIGQVLFDALGPEQLCSANNLMAALTGGVSAMAKDTNSNPVEFLGSYLMETAGYRDVNVLTGTTRRKKPGDTLAPAATLSAKTLTSHLKLDERFDESLQNSDVTDDLDNEVNMTFGQTKEAKEVENQKVASISSPTDNGEAEMEKPEKLKVTIVEDHEELQSALTDVLNQGDIEQELPLTARNGDGGLRTTRLTVQQLHDSTDKRECVAQEVLSSEEDYVATLKVLQDVFHTPLRNALNSNRAIVSAQIVQTVFTDPLTILDMNRELLEDLRCRVPDWSPQNCLGDLFVKFCGRLKVYSNFLTNYQLILTSIERGTEQMPSFRAFLKRHERTPKTKMLSLAELLLCIVRRISEYVTLLSWFKMYTDPEHADRRDLNIALKSLGEMDRLIAESRRRGESERELTGIQKKIINCPLLLEANRFLVKQLDVAGLKPARDEIIKAELKAYQQVEVFGLFLFNDSLLVTRRSTKHLPFERSVERIYRFEACTSLARLRVEEIPDSKYQQHVFRMYTPTREWICAADTSEERLNWITLLQGAVRAHVSS